LLLVTRKVVLVSRPPWRPGSRYVRMRLQWSAITFCCSSTGHHYWDSHSGWAKMVLVSY